MTSLRRREMMWEYDLLQDQELQPEEATSVQSWERTNEILEERSSPSDHDTLSPKPKAVTRLAQAATAKIQRRW